MAKKAAAAAVEEVPSHKLAVSMSKSGPFLSEMTAYSPLAMDKLSIGIQVDFSGTQVVSKYVLLRQDGMTAIHVWQGDVPPTIESRVDSVGGFTFAVAVMCEAADLQKYVAKHAPLSVDAIRPVLAAALTQWNDTLNEVDENGLPDDGEHHEVGELVPEEYEPPFQPEETVKPAKGKKGKVAKNKGGFYDVPQETSELLKIGEFDPADQPEATEETEETDAEEDLLDESDELEDDETEFEEESEDDQLEEVYGYADGEEVELDSTDEDSQTESDDSEFYTEEEDEDPEDEDEDEDDRQASIKLISAAKSMAELMEYGSQLGLPTPQLKKRTTVVDLKKFLIKHISTQD